MSSSATVVLLAVMGLVGMALWEHVDSRVACGKGANYTAGLLFIALACGGSGHWVPEGAMALFAAVVVWFINLNNSLGKGEKA